MSSSSQITAVLGATNTGKTHYALERLLGRASGVMGLPLRLLAREIYDKAVAQKGEAAIALLTGEEKIIPPHARFVICTTEAMPMTEIRAGQFASVVIDEVQMMAHSERGHVFTDRVLHARGTEETLLLGAETVRDLLGRLIPNIRFLHRERFSALTYTGHTKLTRLPKRSVIVAFSSAEVYALAELMRRHYGGTALVMGNLSPMARNAQAALYQSGEVDYMVATDAIGMGLNLDANHVAFAALRKFDGQRRRFLSAHEIGQIAGRAGRFRTPGTFGTTGNSLPLDEDIVARVENHSFEPVSRAEWRSTDLDMSSVPDLLNSLARPPSMAGLRRIAPATDELVLERLVSLGLVDNRLGGPDDVKRLWEVCQIPDFQDLGPEGHARLVGTVFEHLCDNGGHLPEAFIERNIKRLDETGGTADMLSARLSAIRIWRFITLKPYWLKAGGNWENLAQSVESRLSTALHTRLVAQFIDKRTSVLLKSLGEKPFMEAEITQDGEVRAEDQILGHLQGLVFKPDDAKSELENRALGQAAQKVLGPEIDRRLNQIAAASQDAFELGPSAEILWSSQPVGKLLPGATMIRPRVELIGGELGTKVLRDLARARLQDFIDDLIKTRFASLFELKAYLDEKEPEVKSARAVAHLLFENYGQFQRRHHRQAVKDLDEEGKNFLISKGVRFGFDFIFLKEMVRPKAALLLGQLYAFAWDKDGGGHGRVFAPASYPSSAPHDPAYSERTYNYAGYTRRGPRILRFETLASLKILILRAKKERTDDRFRLKKEMLTLLGCTYEQTAEVLKGMHYFPTYSDLTEEEAKIYEAFNARRHKRLQDIKKARENGTFRREDFKPVIMPPPLGDPVIEETPETPLKKHQKPLHNHIVLPDIDENGNPVEPFKLELWIYRKKRPGYKKNRPGPHNDMTNTQTRPAQRASARDKMGKFADVKWDTGKAKPRTAKRKPHKKNARPGQKTYTTGPAKTDLSQSPFAALAALKLADDKATGRKTGSDDSKKSGPDQDKE